jgi:hypothetical protein
VIRIGSEPHVRPGSLEHVQTNKGGSTGTWENLTSPRALSRDGVAGSTSSRLDAANAHAGIGSESKGVCCEGYRDHEGNEVKRDGCQASQRLDSTGEVGERTT